MKKQIFIFWILLLYSCEIDDELEPIETPPESVVEDIDFAFDIGDSELPYIVVETTEEIQNEPKIMADLKVYVNNKRVHQTPIGIEYRGSTSFRVSDKKSYGIETWDENGNDIDYQFFEFPIEEDYILMGHVYKAAWNSIYDPSLLHHYLGYEMYRMMGNYASRSRFVDLEINGDYKGAYVFLEKLKRGKNRIDVKALNPSDNTGNNITGGYILKIDKTAGGESNTGQPLDYYETNWADDARYSPANSFRSNYDIFKDSIQFPAYGEPYHNEQYLETYFLYEHPDKNSITPAQKSYIQNYIHDFETALINDDFNSEIRTYTDYIDLNSFVDFFLLNELVGNIDAYRLSTYLYKDRGEKLKMGPVWDLNIGYGRQNRVPVNDWIANYNNYIQEDAWMVPFWWTRLLEDDVFKSAVKLRWQQLREQIFSNGEIIGLVDDTKAKLISNDAISRNYQRWTGINFQYDQIIEELVFYLENRLQWMDETVNTF